MAPTKVFISYSHNSPEHSARVACRRLWRVTLATEFAPSI